MQEKLFSFEKNDEILKCSSEHGFSDVKFPFAHCKENIYCMLHQKCILFEEYENSTMKHEYQFLCKKIQN